MSKPIIVIISGGVCQDVIDPDNPKRTHTVADFDDFDGGIDPGYWTERAYEVGESLKRALGEDHEHYKDWMAECEKYCAEPPEAGLVTGWGPDRYA